MMGRKRTKDTHLPPRVYRHRAGYRYVPRGADPIPLGSDLSVALAKYAKLVETAKVINSADGTVGWLLEWYLENIHLVAPENTVRTIEDKKIYAAQLTDRMGDFPLRVLRAFHVRDYLAMGIAEKRRVQANREKSLLSHACTIAVERGWMDFNPCLNVKPNTEEKRDRYVSDEEVAKVMPLAAPAAQWLARLVYLTLQRPSDLLKVTPQNIIERDGRRVLRVKQGKTGAEVDIAISAEIDEIFAAARAARVAILEKKRIDNVVPLDVDKKRPIIQARGGRAYSYNSMKAWWSEACRAADVKDFGIYDMKGKGATDMYQTGVPIEQISALCGHQSIRTTEIYIKARMKAIIEPNATKAAS